MSGTNLKYLIICRVFFSVCFAVTWNIGSIVPSISGKNPQSYAFHPACFPDTLCFASTWCGVFRGYGIHEGMIYGGSGQFDVSLITQYHRVMSNHKLSVGFPILNETKIKAGIQLHYTLSALHGVESRHKGSCSGGMIINPKPDWQVSLFSMHILSYPRDSTEHVLEPKIGASTSFSILPSLKLSAQTFKPANFPWRTIMGIAWRPHRLLMLKLEYELINDNVYFNFEIIPGHWRVGLNAGLHRYLGFSQQIVISYEK